MKNVSDATSHQLVEYQQQAKTAQEKLGDVQSALETAWNDISKLKKTIQEQSAQHSHEQKQLEQRLRDEYHSSLRQQAAEEAKKESVLKQTILELRGMLDSSESFSSYGHSYCHDSCDRDGAVITCIVCRSREEDYQRRISTQQQTIDELEGRLAHMSQSTTQTTKPLLRQINELQMQLQAKDETFHAVERSFVPSLAICFGQVIFFDMFFI
jgi:predicted RNase H-like nuclease (RuvC/YqgF family)